MFNAVSICALFIIDGYIPTDSSSQNIKNKISGGLLAYYKGGLLSSHYSWTHRSTCGFLYLCNTLTNSQDSGGAAFLIEIPAKWPG